MFYFFIFSYKSNACDNDVRGGQRRLRLYDSKIANEIFDFDIDFGIAFYQFTGEKAFSDIRARRRVRQVIILRPYHKDNSEIRFV